MSLEDMLNTANEMMDKMEDKDESSNSSGAKGTIDKDAYVVPSKSAWEGLRKAVQGIAKLIEEMISVDGVPSTANLKDWRARIAKIKKQAE